MIPTKGSTVVSVTTEPKVPWSRVPVAGVHNTKASKSENNSYNQEQNFVILIRE
jgi:hypothetical protein